MSCKTLVTTRTYIEPSGLVVPKWSNVANTPQYIRYYFGNVTAPTLCTYGASTATEITVPVPKSKSTQYGQFNLDLFGGTLGNTTFEYRFKVNLKPNTVLSETLTSDSLVLNNTSLFDIDDELPNLFQPLITTANNINTVDVFGLKYGVIAITNNYCSFGFTYESGSLTLHYIFQDLSSCGSYNTIVYSSTPIIISGNVDIALVKNGRFCSFKINGTPESIGEIPISQFISGSNSVFGIISPRIYETRFLYSDICNIYCVRDNQVLFSSTFSDIQTVSNNLVVNSELNTNTLTLYNYELTNIQDLDVCCPIIQLVNADNSELGCCFTPTVEDNIKYKINNWYLNSLGFSSIEYAEMMLKIGKNKEANQKLEKINSVHQFVFYIMSIRNRMVCEGKPYTDFVSDETLNAFVEYFNCRGINIKCPLQIAMIGKYTNCCDQIEASVDCECTDEIPSAIISAPIYQYDLASEADQTLEYTQLVEYPGHPSIVPFSCCSGNQSMVVSSTLINPHNLPISIIPGALTTDGTFNYDITYEYIGSVVIDVKEFYVQFTICGQTILRKHLYSAIDTCVTIPSTVVVENELASIVLEINEDFAFNVETVGVTINLGDFECCHSGQVSKVLSIDTTRITPESGLTILSPIVGQEGQGSILLSYHFNGEQALVGTIQRVYLSYSICDEIVYSGYIIFEVQNNCVQDVTPTLSATTLDFDFNGLGSNTTSFQIGITNYQCCQKPNTITYWFPANGFGVFSQMELFGLTFNLPLGTQQTSSNITLTYTFDRAKYLQFITNGGILPVITYQFEMRYTVCDDPTINSYYVLLNFEDTCSPSIGTTSATSVTLDLYQSLGNPILLNTEITYGCIACDSTSNTFEYLGIDLANNDANFSDLIVTPTSLLSSGYNLPLRNRPYRIDVGDYTDVTYPTNRTTNLTTRSNCDPLAATPIVLNTILVDNYFRSEGGGIGTELQIKTNVFTFDPGSNTNLTFIAHLNGTNMELTSFGYVSLVAVPTSRLRATLYSLDSSNCNSFGSITQNINDVSVITDAIISGTQVAQINEDISALSGTATTAINVPFVNIPPFDGFYFVVLELFDATADSVSIRFDIIL